MIYIHEILMGREKEYPRDKGLQMNLTRLLLAVNELRKVYAHPMIVTSGYRPGHYNRSAGGAQNSAHLTCEAVDISDSSRALTSWIMSNRWILDRCGLYMEDPRYTSSWVHLQTRAPASGNRIFIP